MHTLKNILELLNIDYIMIGKSSKSNFSRILSLSNADSTSLVFFVEPNDDLWHKLLVSPAKVAILEKSWGNSRLDQLKDSELCIFLVNRTRNVIAKILAHLYPDPDKDFSGIHPTATIDPEANLHPSVSIGPYCIIGKCKIAENSIIDAFTTVKDNVTIGKNVHIREYCLIGSMGFGMTRLEDGNLMHVRHIGGVIIGDDVEIYPYSNVDRGTLTDTKIGRGTKIDHYVYVSHNVNIGEDCHINGTSVFCGRSSVGDKVWIGVGTLIKEGVRVNNDAFTGLGAVVVKEVLPGTVVAGVPAKPMEKK